MIAPEPFDGHDPALPKEAYRLGQRVRDLHLLTISPEQLHPGTAHGTGVGLGVETPVDGVMVFP